jgi:sugar lactone lactonase YvrE
MGSALARADVIASGLLFPEGTIFVGADLYFVDYSTSNVLRLDGGTARKLSHLDGCGANGLLHLDGSLVVACFDAGAILRVSLDGKVLDTIEQDDAGGTFDAPNDLTADGRGSVYFTESGVPGASARATTSASKARWRPLPTASILPTDWPCLPAAARLRSDRGAYSPDGLRTSAPAVYTSPSTTVAALPSSDRMPNSFGKSICRRAITATWPSRNMNASLT